MDDQPGFARENRLIDGMVKAYLRLGNRTLLGLIAKATDDPDIAETISDHACMIKMLIGMIDDDEAVFVDFMYAMQCISNLADADWIRNPEIADRLRLCLWSGSRDVVYWALSTMSTAELLMYNCVPQLLNIMTTRLHDSATVALAARCLSILVRDSPASVLGFDPMPSLLLILGSNNRFTRGNALFCVARMGMTHELSSTLLLDLVGMDNLPDMDKMLCRELRRRGLRADDHLPLLTERFLDCFNPESAGAMSTLMMGGDAYMPVECFTHCLVGLERCNEHNELVQFVLWLAENNEVVEWARGCDATLFFLQKLEDDGYVMLALSVLCLWSDVMPELFVAGAPAALRVLFRGKSAARVVAAKFFSLHGMDLGFVIEKRDNGLLGEPDMQVHLEDGSEAAVHREVLVRNSAYFRSILCGSWADKRCAVAEARDVFEVMRSYMYEGLSEGLASKLEQDQELTARVMSAADYYQLPGLQCECEFIKGPPYSRITQ